MVKKGLCIGNANYPEDALSNPVHDAEDIRARLVALGFSSELLRDAKIEDMHAALRNFADDLADAEVGLFFFAGHGVQIEGENYLIATNTDVTRESDIKYSSLPLNKVIDTLDRGQNATSIIILDACRKNPFDRRWRSGGGLGLAPVYAPKGTIIAYATSPGQVAFDGQGRNGAFSSALLQHISTQNVTIEEMFKRVRNTVSAATSGKQISWEHTCLMGDFFFNPSGLGGQFIAEYSRDATADSRYQTNSSGPVDEVIEELRSHSWYTQNPAVDRMGGIDMLTAGKDSLFVLGRNLYQAACGGSNSAEAYFSSLRTKLGGLPSEAAFHILNGILFEIYFDSRGRFRQTKKTECLDEVFAIEGLSEFRRSFEFISNALIPYAKELFYLPASCRDVLVDVTNTNDEEEKSTITSIAVEGQDVFYADAETLVSNAVVEYFTTRSVETFESTLSVEMVVPRRYLKITYQNPIGPEHAIRVPFDYVLQKVAGSRKVSSGLVAF